MNLQTIFAAGLNQQRKVSLDVLVKSSSQSASVHYYNIGCGTVYITKIKFCIHIPDISHCKSFHNLLSTLVPVTQDMPSWIRP